MLFQHTFKGTKSQNRASDAIKAQTMPKDVLFLVVGGWPKGKVRRVLIVVRRFLTHMIRGEEVNIAGCVAGHGARPE